MVRHKVGLSFQLLLWEKKVLLIPGLAFSEQRKKNTGWEPLLYSCASCAQVPGADLGPRGVRSSFSVYGHWSRFLLLIATANSEPWNRWKRRMHRPLKGIDALDFRACKKAEVFARWEPQLRGCAFLCLSPSNPWPDKPFKLEAACVPKRLSVCLNIFNSPGVHITVFLCY